MVWPDDLLRDRTIDIRGGRRAEPWFFYLKTLMPFVQRDQTRESNSNDVALIDLARGRRDPGGAHVALGGRISRLIRYHLTW